MSLFKLSAPLAFSLFAITAAPVLADPVNITGTIDYTAQNQTGDVLAELSKHHSKVVWLSLELLQPAENDSFGYVVSPVTNAEEDDQREGFTCGHGGKVGLIDNFDTKYEISLSNVDDFHAPSAIYIGDRLNFPFQSIYCEAGIDAEDLSTKLIIQGHFVVASALIPTAQETILYPIHVD